MTSPATTTTPRPIETSTSSSTVPRPEPAPDAAASSSVVPPAYLSTAESTDPAVPNYSSIAADQSYYCSAASDDIAASLPAPTSSSSSSTDSSSTSSVSSEPVSSEPVSTEPTSSEPAASSTDGGTSSSTDASTSTDPAADATTSEEATSSEEGDGAVCSEESGDEAATEDAVCSEGDGESTGEEASPEPTSAAGKQAAGGGGDGEEDKGIEAVVAKLPRMALIVTPYVASPPPQAMQRRDQIIKRTGKPPELHHAQVRQSVQQVAQAARDAQRRMVWQVSLIAKDTRISIEDMADEVLKAAGAAVAQINHALDTAMADITHVADQELEYIRTHKLLTDKALEQSRNETTAQIMTDLATGAANIQALNPIATSHFDCYLDQAKGMVKRIPTTGVVGRIPNPPSPPAPPSHRHFPVPKPDPIPKEGDQIADYQLLSKAREALVSTIDTKSRTIASGHLKAADYFGIRATTVLDGMSPPKQKEMDKSAADAADQLGNSGARAQFMTMLLGLTTPVSDYHEHDRGGAVDANERAIRARMTDEEYAIHQANSTLTSKRDQAREYLNRDMREDLTDNIHKMARKAYKGLREQASAAEVALESSAAPMAENYRELVDRIDVLIPPGQFLDSREITPKLLTARDSAEKLRKQHVEMAHQQSDATCHQMQEVKKEQVDSLAKAAEESAKSTHNVVIQTGFDMAVFTQEMTGHMSVRGERAMGEARTYADNNAKSIMDSIHGTEGSGITRIDQTVVGFFNGRIAGAEQSQFAGLAAFVEHMETAGGPLETPMNTANSDLNRRATALDTAMPIRDGDTVTDMALGGDIIGLGVYLYHTDASESNVIKELGNLMWPGILGLEEVFTDHSSDSLRHRIETRLNDTEKGQALRLFSESAEERGAARLEIARGSTAWFSGVNAEARESVLQGMSDEERTLNADDVASTTTFLTGELSGTQQELSLAYLAGDRDAAAAARVHESMEKARHEGEWGWIFSADQARKRSDSARVEAMSRMDEVIRSELSVETAFVEQGVIDAHHDNFFRNFASFVDPNHRSAASFLAADARTAVRTYATEGHNTAVIGLNPLGLLFPPAALQISIERVETGSDASRYISDVIAFGPNSPEARDSRGVFELNRADDERSGVWGSLTGLSNTTQGRLTDAFEDRELASLEARLETARVSGTAEERSRLERQVHEARDHHQARMQSMAARLGAPSSITSDPAAAEAWMAARLGRTFASTDTLSQAIGLSKSGSHSRYGEEMITHGRASLDATVALASDGWGTNDDLLRRGYADRTHLEIARANSQWSIDHDGESMTEMLGIKTASDTTPVGAGSWFDNLGAETSGDLAQELQVLALGNPENDADRVTIASLRYRQQHDAGTGWITDSTMRGTDEEHYLNDSHSRMAQTILNAAAAHDPSLLARFGDNPNGIFNPDGSLNSAVSAAAFDAKGHFLGDSTELQARGDTIGFASDAFRAEVDRQEAMVMSGITLLALVVSVVLLVVPGVDIVAAGVITAILTGAATIAAKAGMRGGRYGWEEAATDVAQAAIEAAAAGVGGAMTRGMTKAAETTAKLGRLARFGEMLGQRFGKVGGAIVREAIVGAASTAAQTAIQDETWNDGIGAGIGHIANGAIRGAAVSAATTAVSEGVTHMFTRPRVDANKLPIDTLGEAMEKGRLGKNMSEIVREGITNTAGTMVGEAVGLGIDYAQGNFHGTFGDAMKQIGMAGLRELVVSTARSRVMIHNRENYHRLLAAAESGGTLSHAELRALRAYGISAGELHRDQSIEDVHKIVLQNRVARNSDMLALLPPNLREHVMSLDGESLKQLVTILHAGGDPMAHPQHQEFIMGLAGKLTGVTAETLVGEFANVIENRRAGAASELDPAHQAQLREHLGEALHPELRFALKDVPVDGLQHLSPEHLAVAAAMIAKGQFHFDTADTLLRAAKAQNPHLDEFAFLQNLHNAVKSSEHVQAVMMRGALERHRDLVAMVPKEAASVFATLGQMEVLAAHRLISTGNAGTPQERDSLFHAAKAKNPDLTRDQFHGFMETAANHVRQQMDAEHQARRTAREERMTHVPEELRGTLSALPETALVELRLRQMEGNLSPDDMTRLVDMAKHETPGVDVHALTAAIEQAVQHKPATHVSDAEASEMRRHLLSAVPADQQASLGNTHIMVLPADEFAALTRSQKGQAVTLLINGEPVVVMREGASPHVLREEGIHAMQAKDPKWREHIGALNEHTMAQWDSLPLAQQIELYRAKVALELDAQTHLMHSLEGDIANTADPIKRQALQQHLEQVQQTHENLSRRHAEVNGLSDLDIGNMHAGFTKKPQWLEQPARLFAKENLTPKQIAERDGFLAKLTAKLKPGGDADLRWRDLAEKLLDFASLGHLVELHSSPVVLRETILDHAQNSGNPKAFIEAAHHVGMHLDEASRVELMNSEHGRKLLTAMANSAEPISLTKLLSGCDDNTQRMALLKRLALAPNPLETIGHLNSVVSLIGDQGPGFVKRLAAMEIANVPDHIRVFADLAQHIADPRQVKALFVLANNLEVGEYKAFVGQVTELAKVVKGLEAGLPDHEKGLLMGNIIRAAAAHDETRAFYAAAHTLLSTMAAMPNTPNNRTMVEAVRKYLSNPLQDPIHLAADVAKAAGKLLNPSTQATQFAAMATRLLVKDRLVGGNSWHEELQSHQANWVALKDHADHKAFAALIDAHPATQGWSEGQKGALLVMGEWFNHLAAQRKAKGTYTSDADLMTEILKRGFDSSPPHNLSSKGRLTDMNRAFRELAMEEQTGIRLKTLDVVNRDAAREAAALTRAGIKESDMAHLNPQEREALLQHLYILEARHEFYTKMGKVDEGFTYHSDGMKQNVTEVLGEMALTSYMTKEHKDLRLAIPFGKGTGFDQIWKGMKDGKMVYVIGEAKGPGATLSTEAGKGPQMTAEWVVNTLKEMIATGTPDEKKLAQEIRLAIMQDIASPSAPPRVTGVVIQHGNSNNLAENHTGGKYNFTSYEAILEGLKR